MELKDIGLPEKIDCSLNAIYAGLQNNQLNVIYNFIVAVNLGDHESVDEILLQIDDRIHKIYNGGLVHYSVKGQQRYRHPKTFQQVMDWIKKPVSKGYREVKIVDIKCK